MCDIERSNPSVGVDQILKRYLEYFSSYKHFQNLNAELEHGSNEYPQSMF